MKIFKTIWEYWHSYCLMCAALAYGLIRMFALIILVVILCIIIKQDDYEKRLDCNTFVLATIISVDTIRNYGDQENPYEYCARCEYQVKGKKYTARFPEFVVSPPVGLQVPVYYDSDSSSRYSCYSEFSDKLRSDPYYFYGRQLNREKENSSINKRKGND